MSNEIKITNHAIPATARSKNHQLPTSAGSVYTSSGSGGGAGGAPQLIKLGSSLTPSDDNVLSSLRALFEIRSRIVASDNAETELSEENTLSSLHTIAEIDAAIKLALLDIEKLYLSKTKADTATEAITFLKGLLIGDNIAHIDANGDAEVRNIVARIKAKVATLEVTGSATVGSLAAKESVTSKTVTASEQATTLNLLVQLLASTYDLNVSHVATMMRTIIKDYVSSEAFTPGLMGEGFKISKALNGDWNLEIDNVVVRKVMTIFEMIISKVRSVNGGLVISPANGRIKSVAETTGSPAYYVIGIEGDMQFVVDDYVRCQVFSNGHAKFYWVRVSSISGNSILVLKSEFTNGAVPAVGDDLVQMGNATNTARQGLIYLTASEDGKPRISVMDGVNSTSLVGKNKVILGCLDGITDTDFPADFQPSGYGLYAMNVFLKGIFVLRNGKSVEGEIEAAQNAASVAQAKADTVTRLFQEFTVAGGLFESKITETKTYADGKAKEAKDAANAYADGKVDGLQVGGRNLALNSGIAISNNSYNIANYVLSEELVAGNTYVATILGQLGEGKANFGIWLGGGHTHVGYFKKTEDGKYLLYFTAPNIIGGNGARNRINIYCVASEVVATSAIYKFKLEKGNKPTDWTPAPEDVTADAQAKANAAQAAAEAVAIAKATLAKTEASAYADGIVTAEEQRAIADAQAKLAEAKLDAQAKANDAKQAAINDAANKYPTKSEVTSSINQKADEINLSVTEKISGVQVGGTNLLKNSSNWRAAGWNGGITSNGGGYTIDNTVLYHGNPTLKTDVGSGLLHSWLKLDAGIEYTYSAMVLCESYIPNSSVVPLHYHAGKDNTQQSKINVTKSDTELTPGVWKLIHIVFKLTGDANSFRPFLYRGANSGTFFWVAYMKLERGNKPTDWTPAPEDVQFQITENKAQIQVLSDQIALKVSNDTFNALGNRVSAAEANLTVQATQIASKVSQSDFNTLGQRVGSAESAITQQATQISSKVSTTEFDKLGVRVSSAESEIKQQSSQISLMVKKDDLTITGIDIVNRKITLTADSTVFRNNSGQQIAIFENDRIKTDLIDSKAIVTSVLAATNVTATNLTVTGNSNIGGMVIKDGKLTGGSIVLETGARIGGMKVSGLALTNEGFNNDAYIILRNDNKGTFIGIGGDVMPSGVGTRATGRFECEGSQYGLSNTALVLRARGATGFGARNIALDMQGEIITRSANGSENTGKTFNIALFDAWVGGQGKQVELTVTNGIITGWKFF